MNLNIQKGLEGVCWFPDPLALIGTSMIVVILFTCTIAWLDAFMQLIRALQHEPTCDGLGCLKLMCAHGCLASHWQCTN